VSPINLLESVDVHAQQAQAGMMCRLSWRSCIVGIYS